MLEEKSQNGFSKTWMLFESGNVVVVDLSIFSAPKESIRPIDAYVVTEVSSTVNSCARRAAASVYEIVRIYYPEMEPVVVGFDFAVDYPVTGDSGGLAFAVALAKRLLDKDPGPVAATGIVESSHNGGPVRAVKAIDSKLEAAGIVLPPGGWIVYPKENEKEVSPELIHSLKARNLKPCPVSSVAETITLLFKNTPEKKPEIEQNKKNRTQPFMMILLIIVILIFLAIALWKGSFLISDQLLQKQNESVPVQQKIELQNKLQDRLSKEQGIDVPTKPFEMDAPLSDDKEEPVSRLTISIFGKTRMNAEISKILADKLTHFFATLNYPFDSLDHVFVSGEVVVLRMEENWVEEKESYRSNIKAALRNFVYEDRFRKIEQENIEVFVYAIGMVEDMLPLTAQALTNKIINLFLSEEDKESRES